MTPPAAAAAIWYWRVQHLNWAGLYDKVAEIVKAETLFSGRAQGNLL
jgi:hypothetical protein